MKDHETTIRDIKAELLSLFVQSNEKFINFNQYFELFQKSIFKFFGIQNSCFFMYQDNTLKVIAENVDVDLLRNGIPWTLIEPSFENKNVAEFPSFLIEKETFSNLNQMLLLNTGEEVCGIIAFQATSPWLDFSESEYIDEYIEVISRMFKVILESIEIKANETQYRKLYNMTDLFHSTMDIDMILENVLITIEENFPDFGVELILSNDQDRQTKVKIKPFDYLSERPLTIEAFVSGEISVEYADDLGVKLLNVPIKGRQAIYGILQVSSSIDYIYSNAEKNFIRMLARASGNALENAKLYYQSHRLITDLQLINETSHRLNLKLNIEEMLRYLQMQLIKSFQPMELCFVFKEQKYKLTDAVTELFLTDAGKIYLEHVEKHFETSQEPLFIADFSRLISEEVTYKSLMAIPLLVEEKINGYCIVLHSDPYFFSFDSFKLMQSLIHHSALAISNSVLQTRLQEMVDRDHLTKLYARRYLDRFVEDSLRDDKSGMFLLIDIDNFKKVNDTFGHQIGDEVLVQIANQLKLMIGTRGICARWGGEELAVYIPNLLESEAFKIASQIVESIPLRTEPRVTVSAGLVSWGKNNLPEFQSIFLQADTALYKAKHNGKNQYCIFNETMHLQS